MHSNNTLEKWEEKQLKDICEFHNGLWTGKKEPFIECNVIRNANFTKDFKLNYDNVVKINVEERQFLTRELQYGDLILEKSGGGPNQPVGRVVIFDKHEKGYSFSNFTSSIRIKNKDILNFRFLYLYLCHCYLSGMTTKMQKNSTGIRNLLFDDYKNISVPIPNISEQQWIVGILDKAFENIEKAKQNTLQNLNNAKELFENYLNQIFIVKDSWIEKNLDDVCIYKSGTTISKDLEKDSGDLLYIKVGDMNLRGNEECITTSARYADSKDINKNQIINAGAIIFPKRGGAIATNKKRKIIKPTIIDLNTMAIITNNEILNEYFYYWFKQINLADISNGTTVPQINNYSFKGLKIAYPIDLSEQQKIVSQLDELQEQTKKLEQIYTQKLKDLDELKQSILQKAFKGEL